MDPKTVVDLVKALGLPGTFCLWLMWRVEQRLDRQTDLLREAGQCLARILEHVRGRED